MYKGMTRYSYGLTLAGSTAWNAYWLRSVPEEEKRLGISFHYSKWLATDEGKNNTQWITSEDNRPLGGETIAGCCGSMLDYRPATWARSENTRGFNVLIGPRLPDNYLPTYEGIKVVMFPGAGEDTIHIKYTAPPYNALNRSRLDPSKYLEGGEYCSIYWGNQLELTDNRLQVLDTQVPCRFLFSIFVRNQAKVKAEMMEHYKNKVVFDSPYTMNTNYTNDPERISLVLIDRSKQ